MKSLLPGAGLTRKVCLLAILSIGAASLHAQTAPKSPRVEPISEEPLQLSVFEVRATQEEGYGSTNSAGGSRVNLPLQEIPSSIITINEQLLKDLGTVEIYDALGYVSGVAPQGEQYSLRGYSVGGLSYRDGLPDRESALNNATNDAGSVQRVEVIKGPAGVLYGAHSMGGIINRVSKMPLTRRETTTQLNVSAGWDEFIRGMIDTTGPIGPDGMGYRLILAERQGGRAWGSNDDRRAITGTLRYAFGKSKRQSVWARFHFLEFNATSEQGWSFVDKDFKVAPYFTGRNRDFYNFPLDSNAALSTISWEAGYQIAGNVAGGDWTLRLLGRYNKNWGDKSPSYSSGTIRAIDANGAILGTNATVSVDDPRVADWRATLIARDFESFFNQGGVFLDAAGKYQIGSTSHTVIVSAEARTQESRRTFKFWNAKYANAPTSYANSFSLIPERAHAEMQGLNFITIVNNGGTPGFTIQNAPNERTGEAVGFQENAAFFGKKLILVGGVRYDQSSSTTKTINSSLVTLSERTIDKDAWTYKVGAVVQLPRGLSLFAQRATTFNPVDSTEFPNQDGKTSEVGFKIEMFDGKLMGTASVFRNQLSNVSIAVPRPPEEGGGTVLKPVGKQDTEGWEVDLALRPFKGFSAVVAFSDLTSLNEQGKPFRGVPQTPTYSTFLRYVMQEGRISGLGFGLGYQHTGTRTGDAAGTFWWPAMDQFDALVSFAPKRKKWSVQLNVINVLNADDVRNSVSTINMNFIQPTTYRLSYSFKF